MTTNEKPASGPNRKAGCGDASDSANCTLNASTLCPRWNRCSTPLCPLDPDVFKRAALNDEPVCYYLTEAVKSDAEAIFRRRGRSELYELISKLIQPMSARWGRIRRHLERAKSNGSRMARLAPWEVDHGA